MFIGGLHDSVLAQDRAEDLIIAGQRGGMTGHGPAALPGLAGFEDDHRFSAVPGQTDKGPALILGKTLDIKGNNSGSFVGGQEFKELWLADQGLVADADGTGNPHSFSGKLDQQINENAAALADHGYTTLTGLNHAFGREEKSVNHVRRIETKAVGTDKGKIMGDGNGRQLFLQFNLAGLGKTTGDNDRTLDAGTDTILEHLWDELGADRNDGQINLLGEFMDGGVDRLTVQGSTFGVDPVTGQGITEQILAVNDIGRMMVIAQGQTNDGHGFRKEQRRQIHGSDPVCGRVVCIMPVLHGTQKKAQNNTDGKHQEQHQGTGQGKLPEQKLDTDRFGVLQGKDDHGQQQSDDQGEFGFHGDSVADRWWSRGMVFKC